MTEEDEEGGLGGFDDLLSEAGGSSFAWEGEVLDGEGEDDLSVLAFRVGEDRYCVSGDSVREVLGSAEVTPLPGAPEYLLGITILRRQVVGLLAMDRFLGRAREREVPVEELRVLVVETAHYVAGIVVDEITGLRGWPKGAMDPATLPENFHSGTRRYAVGCRAIDEGLEVLLDLEELLDAAAIQ